MYSSIFFAWALAATTVVVHAVGLALMLRFLDHRGNIPMTRVAAISTRLVWVACYMVLLHLIAISIWGAFYVWLGCLPDLETAFYFSGVTYATIGYGDVVLANPWRLLGLMEGLTGILMCGLSTGVFIAVVNQIYQFFHSKIDDHKH
ncbi:potassium channel family protein [Metapseudomonas boanensis]|uniref:Two pore domain potassium channel family protein n=1 Tax=Metapseudomonas boanensis TaxID=2822138 RepID=A0ABS5XP22_9GAMM|nr:potassium channel family protein [Pseudomonas boanensis]MBT8769435.1 two pore domain potassium channel family protein [Pseudomonas boanensis]